MKKILTKFLPLLLLISLISCNQLVVGIEKTFSYWANGATIIGIELPPNTPVDGEGFFSLPSGQDARICFKLNNPQKFEFLMPGDSNAPADIIVFDENVRGKNGGRPELGEGKDYSLIQKSSDTLELTYTKEFLLKNEQGKANLNPKIKLYNKKDNRRFAQNYNYKLRANTVPPKPECVTAGKIKDGENWYYVLIFKFEGLTNLIDTENLLHGDISEVYLTEGESQKAPIQVKLTKEGFDVSHSQGNLIPQDAAIMALASTDLTGGSLTGLSAIPNANDRKWMLCIKTGVKTGDSLSYKIEVKDLRGLAPKETEGVINKAKLPVPKISYHSDMGALTEYGVYTDNVSELSTGTSANPILISSCFGKAVVLKAYHNDYSPSVTINAKVKLSASTQAPADHSGGTGSIQQDGNITKIFLDPIPEVDEIYEVKLKASGSNYTDSDEKTYYYKIKKEVRTGDSSWQILKNAVNLASAEDTIYINGHIKSTSTADNSGEIEVKESIHIQGLNGKTTDIIDAESKHRIFEVKENKSLTLRNITLKKGKVEGSTYEATGGAIKAGNGSVLTLDNTDIADSEAGMAGGAISSTGNIDIKGNSVIRNNITISSNGLGGAIYNGGILKISGDAKITVDSAKNDVYLPMGKVITVTGNLLEYSVARISPVSLYTVGRQVVEAASDVTLSSQVSKFKVSDDTDGEKWRINTTGQLEKDNQGKTVTSWAELKTEVEKPSGGAEVIIVDGTETNLTAIASTDEINVNRNVTIIGKNSNITLNADEKCRIFKVSNGVTLKLKDITLKKGKEDSGVGVYVTEASLELENVTITECKSKTGSGMGGAIYINNLSHNGRLWIKGTSKIEVNGAYTGAGIYINTALGENIIEGNTKIKGNKCFVSGNGGGIYIEKGTLVLKGNTKIFDNESKNSDTDGGGGGIYIKSGSTLTIKDSCEIKNNKAKNKNNDNTTGYGGGICNLGTIIMEGGTITGNEAKEGGAVYNNGTFTMSGSAQITPSSDEDEHTKGKNDVYLNNSTVINVNNTLTAGENQAARITVPKSKYDTSTQVLTGSTAENANKFKVTKKGTQNWYVDNDGKLTTTAP